VQFAGPVKKQWLAAARRLGAEPRELYQDFIYVVRADLATARAVAALPCVLWVAHLPHEQRLAPSLKGESQQRVPRTRLRVGVYTVQVFDRKLTSSVAAAARRLGFQVLSKPTGGKTLVVRAQASLAGRTKLVRTLATVHGVRFIRARPIRRTSNDVAVRLMGVATGTPRSRFEGQGPISTPVTARTSPARPWVAAPKHQPDCGARSAASHHGRAWCFRPSSRK
jgi:hypothetical protein